MNSSWPAQAGLAARSRRLYEGDTVSSLVIVGAPRSGTTLLYSGLCLHPDATYLSNWMRRRPSAPWLAMGNRAARRLPSQRREAWFPGGSAYVYGRRRSLRERAFPAPVEGAPVFDRVGVEGLGALGATLTRFGGGRVWVSKCVGNNARVHELFGALPEPRFVHVVRDGRAVAESLSRVDWWPDAPVWWLGQTPTQWEASGGDPWELRARHWLEELAVIEAGLARLPAERVMRVRYEDVTASPVDAFERLADFGGLRRSARWSAELAALPIGNRNGRATSAPPVVTALQHQLLAANGYAP